MMNPEGLFGEADFVFGGLSIWANSRQFPESDDFWDENWLNIYARMEAAGARVEIFGPCLRADEIAGFLDDLKRLNLELEGAAELNCMEPMLRVEIVCRNLGQLNVVVEITPDHMTQAHRFVLALDQTYLALAIEGCQRILTKFPVQYLETRQGRGQAPPK